MDLTNLIAITGLAVISLEVITGISGNIFILYVISFQSCKRLDKSACDKIIVALAISSVCHVCILTINILSELHIPGIYMSLYVAYAVTLLTVYSANSCIWLTAVLCFYYFIRITTFSSNIFTWFKTKINKIITWMIFMSQIMSTFSSSLSLIQLVQPINSTRNHTAISSNMTSGAQGNKTINIAFLINCFPILIMMVTTSTTVVFLSLHCFRLRRSMGTLVSVNVAAYGGVVRTMISSLVFYGIFYTAMFTYSLGIFKSESLEYWIMSILLFSFTTVQSIFLISGTPKLKNAWEQMLFCVKGKISLRS
ncbi:taste receptor type 2 member 9-like [Pseudophryne corroboree]|uniref:taste receptor type 2 member 9-like n=1 Tax=Pseudophryne corroboree TaxID=495146 RepID=UPI0030820D67